MKQQQRTRYSFFVIAVCVALLLLIGYIFYRIELSDRRLFSMSILPLLAGVLFESLRISKKWNYVLILTLVAFLASLLMFLPGKNETYYDFEHHIEIWPYGFLGFFIFGSIVFHGDALIAKITEGITLLQSIAVMYWVWDQGWAEIDNLFLRILMGIGLAFSLLAIFHAFTYVLHTRASRLALSIWSSMIMMLFAVDHAIHVFGNDMDNTTSFSDGFYMGLQYFLLGVSSIYMVQNMMMLAGFLPGRGTFFNRQYFQEIGALRNDHINRYLERQVRVVHSLFCVIFAGGVFYLNHYYQFVPAHTAIWAVFVVFPILLSLIGKLAVFDRPS